MADSIELGPIDLADVLALDEALARTTAAPGFGVTDGGFVPKPFARLLAEKLALARSMLGADLDLTSGSVVRKLLELSALEDARTWAALARIYDDQYVASAAGIALTRLGEELGVGRPFLEATGSVTLTFVPPAGRPSLTIPRGARLVTTGGHHAATLAQVTLTTERPSRAVEVAAFYPGPDHNLDPADPAQRLERWNVDDRKLEWDGAVPGLTQLARIGNVAPEAIVGVVHAAALTGGEVGWPDARYRKLLLRAPRALWSADGIRLAASLVPGVRQVQVIDDLGGLDVDLAVFGQFRFGEALFAAGRDLVAPHTVDVLVAPRPAAITGEGPGNLAADVAAAIEDLRPIGIRLRVTEADQVFIGIEATIATEGLPIPRSATAQLTSPVANELKQRLLARVAEYVEGLRFGEPVRCAEVIFALMGEPGVTDVTDLHLLRFPPLNPQAADPVHGYQRMNPGVNVQVGATQITVSVNDDRWLELQ
jgi:hypothetical protein